MKMHSVRVATTVLTIARLSILTRPNLLIEDKIGNALILFKFLENNGTVNTCL
jgi:hypothetical protein